MSIRAAFPCDWPRALFRACRRGPPVGNNQYFNRLFCFGGLQPWFRARQTDFQSQNIRAFDPGELAEEMLGIDIDDYEGLREIIGNGSPAFPPFTENHSNDRFGSAIAIMPPVSGFKIRLLIGSSDKALKRRAAAGAVFIFRKSLTNDAPRFAISQV